MSDVFVFTFRSGWFTDKNSVTGSSDMLTVCIANDLAAKRLGHKQHANIIKKFGGNNSYTRKYGSEYTIFILYIHCDFCALEYPGNTFLTSCTFMYTFYMFCMYAHVCGGGRVCVRAQAHRYGPKPCCLQSAFLQCCMKILRAKIYWNLMHCCGRKSLLWYHNNLKTKNASPVSQRLYNENDWR